MGSFVALIKTIDEKLDIPKWLVYLLGLVVILRIPSLLEPYYYGDEMIYMALGEGMRQGLTFYRDIHDNKPPLLYILAGVAGSLFWFKVMLAAANIASIILFKKLVAILFPKSTNIIIVSTVIFAMLTTLPLLEGNIVNSELFMIAFTIGAFIILLSKELNFKNLLFAGVLFSVGTLFKVPSAFDVPVIFAFWVIVSGIRTKEIFQIIKNSAILLVGFLLPIVATMLWYYFKGAFSEYLIAAFLQNVGYLSTFRPDDAQKPFLERNFPLLIRAAVVAIATSVLYLKRKQLSKPFIFASLWLFFSLFAVTLSERPYPHYLIQSVGPVSILLAMLLKGRSMEQVYVIIPLAVALFVPVYYKFWYYPTTPYYVNFVKFATGQITKWDYFNTFSNKVSRDYEIADFLVKTTTKSERVFVWEDGSTIYALSRRLPPTKFVAGYHIKDFSSKQEQAEKLTEEKPSVIILLPNSGPFPEIASLIATNYARVMLFEDVEVYRLLNTGH